MSVAQVFIHHSQFPARIMDDYVKSFQSKIINHKFHYDSAKQSQKWLALHDSYSPAKQHEGYVTAYHQCFDYLLDRIEDHTIDLLSLGCGGGEKEKILIEKAKRQTTQCHRQKIKQFFPIDVSVALALVAAQVARTSDANLDIIPFVCDLLASEDVLNHVDSKGDIRVLTFFGMIPNFHPRDILPILSHFLRPGDYLLFSANLAPGEDYDAGIKRIVPQYDNAMTKDWLQTILLDAGVDKSAGSLQTCIKATVDLSLPTLKRIAIDFVVDEPICLQLHGDPLHWYPGDVVQLFFSYRYTTTLLTQVLAKYNIETIERWESLDGEEGVYLCQKVVSRE